MKPVDGNDGRVNRGSTNGQGRLGVSGGEAHECRLRVLVPEADQGGSRLNAQTASAVEEAEKKLKGIKDKDAESIYSHEIIEAFAILYRFDPTRFAKHKAAVKGSVNLNDFQRAVKENASRLKRERTSLSRCSDDGHHQVPYRATRQGLVYDKNIGDVTIPVHLTNFTAEIVSDVTEDDGSEQRRVFEISAVLRGRKSVFYVTADRFANMHWVADQLGAEAIVYAGSSTKDHTRVAIQSLSENIRQQVIYKHTGWRNIDGDYCFLHAGGSLGPLGPLPNNMVQLEGEHTLYDLPAAPSEAELHRCIEAVLQLRRLSVRSATCCLEGAVFRAPLGDCDSTVWLTGRTGKGKSELAARYQQAFGAGFHAKALPGSWSSTGNALEVAAHTAKDVLFVIDDFCPRGTAADQQRYHQLADRVIRAQRNKAGRQRLWADGRLRPTKRPRGVIVGTGEDIPNGHSLRASMMILEISDVDWDLMTECQRFGAKGVYAGVMASYIQWLAGQYERLRRNLQSELEQLREEAARSGDHRRTPELVANLALGVRYFLDFAQDVGALGDEAASCLWDESWAALGEAASAQREFLAAAEPVNRFLDLLFSALASGEAHVAAADGGAPQPSPQAWGWKKADEGSQYYDQGKRIGWLDGNDLYLDPDASFKAVQEMARHTEGITVGQLTLQRRLRDAGHIESTESNRLTVRRDLDGRRRRVLHISRRVWVQKVGQVGHVDHEPGLEA